MKRPAPADTQATEDGWLTLHRGGLHPRDIARECGLGMRRIYDGLANARFREARNAQASQAIRPPSLVLILGPSCKALTLLTCDDVHRGPLPAGTRQCCGVCHRSGVDDHPGLKRDPSRDPKPEKKHGSPMAHLTRSQKRALKRILKAGRS